MNFGIFKSSFNPYHEIGWFKRNWRKLLSYNFSLKYLTYRLKWNLIGRYPIPLSSPIHVDIETASACNLKCIMCPHGDKNYEHDNGIMKDSLARKLIQDCIDSAVISIKFSGRGEALLHKNMVEYVEMAKEGGVLDVMFNTNALLLTPTISKGLIKAGLDLIIISIDGTTKEIYEKIRKGSDFDTVVNNVENLIQMKRDLGVSKPMIRLQFVKMEDNIHEFDDFIKKWQAKVDVIVGIDYSNRVNQKDKSIQKRVATGRTYCPHPFRRLAINYKGDALMCCVDWDSRYKVGDMNQQSIKEVWSSQPIQYGRECIRKLDHKKIVSCRTCFSPISYKYENQKTGNGGEK
jgi:MoaA/NifB/PqqE/SkfB family radical SAM enzyme